MKLYKNTFSSRIRNKELTLDGIMMFLKMNVIKYDSLPDDIKKDVDKVLR